MALDNVFNGVTFDALVNDPNISVKIGDEIEAASWEESRFEPFLGKGEGRGVRFFSTSTNEPYRPRLRIALDGEGVEGNADIAENLDNLNIMSQTIYPKVIANGVNSEIDTYQAMKKIDFVKHASDALKTWMLNKRDKMLYAALANDLTNAIVCDATNGFKEFNQNSVSDAGKQIVAGDTLNVAAIERGILMAKAGISGLKNGKAFPMKPVKSTKRAENGLNLTYHSYIVFVDSYQAEQLRADPAWKDMQAHAPRNELHRVFTGYLGMISGCPIVEMGTYSSGGGLGLMNSTISDNEFKKHIIKQNFGGKIVCPSAYAKSQPVSIGFIIGASALIMAGTDSTRFFINNKLDEGRKTRCSVDRLLAISKSRFELSDSDLSERAQKYVGTDYGVIGLLSSME